MGNDCGNRVIIRGKAEDVATYKKHMPKVDGKYLCGISTVPLPEFTEAEYKEFFERENGKTFWKFSYRIYGSLEMEEPTPEKLILRFSSWMTQGEVGAEIPAFKGLNILQHWFEPMNNLQGFRHWVDGALIAEGRWYGYKHSDFGQEECPLYSYHDPEDPPMEGL